MTFQLTLPTFSGATDIQVWIRDIERAFVLKEIKDPRFQTLWAIQSLTGLPKSVCEGKEDLPWGELKAILVGFFSKSDQRFAIRKQLSNLKANGNLHDYVQKFLGLKRQLADLGSEEAKFFFFQGLEGEVLAELLFKNPDSLEDCVKYVITYADAHGCSAQQSTAFQQGNQQFPTTEVQMMDLDALRNRRQSTPKRSFQRRNSNGNDNHRGRSPFQSRSRSPHPSNRGVPSNSSRASKACFSCGKVGHIERDCWNRQRSSSRGRQGNFPGDHGGRHRSPRRF